MHHHAPHEQFEGNQVSSWSLSPCKDVGPCWKTTAKHDPVSLWKGRTQVSFHMFSQVLLFLISYSYLMTEVCTRSWMNNLPPISMTLPQKHAFSLTCEIADLHPELIQWLFQFSKALHWAWWGWMKDHVAWFSSLVIGLGSSHSSHRFPARWSPCRISRTWVKLGSMCILCVG